MNKLNVVIMGQDAERFLPMCLKSVQDADNIIFCDGGSTDNTLNYIEGMRVSLLLERQKNGGIENEYSFLFVIENKYNQEDKGMNGKQRGFYLDYLKKHHLGEWVLVLDADEVLDDGGIQKIRDFIDNPPENMTDIISVKMRHFIESLGNEDATKTEHFVPHRLFKIKEDMFYPETEHPVLHSPSVKAIMHFRGTTIWHLAYCKRYLNHLKKSEMHTKEFLLEWYLAHLFGRYPKKQVGAWEIPETILNEFLIDKDLLYFKTHSTLETKHFIMSKQWISHFGHEDFKPLKVLDLGCGIGLFGYALDSYGTEYAGIEKSQWAVDNTPYKHLDIIQGDITEKQEFTRILDTKNHLRENINFDLVLVLDVLEHLEEKDLEQALRVIKDYGKNYLFSIPYDTDPNIDLDPTHKIKKSKEWWVLQLSKYFKISDVPDEFMYGKQMLIGVLK